MVWKWEMTMRTCSGEVTRRIGATGEAGFKQVDLIAELRIDALNCASILV